MNLKKLPILLLASASLFVTLVGCASSSEGGEVAKPDVSPETRQRFQPQGTPGSGATQGGTAQSSGPATPPPSTN